MSLRHVSCVVASRSPDNVQVARVEGKPDDIMVSWRPLTLFEARGFIEYVVELHEVDSGKRQAPLRMVVPMDMSSTIFPNTDPGANYAASVGTQTPSLDNMPGPGESPTSM